MGQSRSQLEGERLGLYSQSGAIPEMKLTPQELAYLDRFCYEVGHFLHGEGSVFQQCPGHYQDLGALTNFAPPEVLARWISQERQPPPTVPFPWASLEAISDRLAELESVHGRSGIEPCEVQSHA
jgi:hypothetical protein